MEKNFSEPYCQRNIVENMVRIPAYHYALKRLLIISVSRLELLMLRILLTVMLRIHMYMYALQHSSTKVLLGIEQMVESFRMQRKSKDKQKQQGKRTSNFDMTTDCYHFNRQDLRGKRQF